MVADCSLFGVNRATSFAFVPLSRREWAKTIAPEQLGMITVPGSSLLTWKIMITQQQLAGCQRFAIAKRGGFAYRAVDCIPGGSHHGQSKSKREQVQLIRKRAKMKRDCLYLTCQFEMTVWAGRQEPTQRLWYLDRTQVGTKTAVFTAYSV